MRTRRLRRTPRRRLLASSLAGLTAAVCLGVAGVDRSQATPDTRDAEPVTAADPVGPPQNDFPSALAYSLAHPTAVPTGANDFTCRPGAAHPRPVVLVHGTMENRYDNWAALAPLLKEAGYCVFALNHGGSSGALLGTGDMAASARQLADFVDRVRAATGAVKVDLVGHSQGGMMPRYYIKNLGGAAEVDKLVALTPSNHGTTFSGLGLLALAFPGGDELLGVSCKACEQQLIGSDFLRDLNAGGETDPDITYTVITTRYDEVVTPYISAYLDAAPNVTNIKLQDRCPAEFTEHVDISYNDLATRLVLNALDPAHAQRPIC
ncbi:MULTISPECIES: alpha/beta fold hydrolase [unclassified Streptomyces]|uniref:esterase/lipase family protein n=1 Tax=unclassified Streptomyces TaxID=2593676 RepID=UPI002366AC36|nr:MULTISPECIES: alpha/beta fold hydrolase [unclassified Streptomyces]MDF3144814.1 alpha/beta fold hydrolase [Streptomyces sp. T21Q-yed]WDF43798.1 alpha/beta fold hydrolase [Streptomyces sp. T12]